MNKLSVLISILLFSGLLTAQTSNDNTPENIAEIGLNFRQLNLQNTTATIRLGNTKALWRFDVPVTSITFRKGSPNSFTFSGGREWRFYKTENFFLRAGIDISTSFLIGGTVDN